MSLPCLILELVLDIICLLSVVDSKVVEKMGRRYHDLVAVLMLSWRPPLTNLHGSYIVFLKCREGNTKLNVLSRPQI